ncbi:MAG: ABC transporter permease [Acidimicrobiia bacterium]
MLRVSLKSILGNWRRLLGSSIAVLLGVAFLAGTLILSDTMKRSFDTLFENANKATDAYVEGKGSFDSDFTQDTPRIPESMVDTVRALPGTKDAEPFIQSLGIQLVNKKNKVVTAGGAPSFGFSWTGATELNPYKIQSGRAPETADEIAIDRAMADRTKYKLGETAKVVSGSATKTYTIVGIVTFGEEKSAAGSTAIFFTLPELQRINDAPGQIDNIYASAKSGVSQQQLVDQIRSAVGNDVTVKTGEQLTKDDQKDLNNALAGLRIFFTIFAVIALFVSTFVIYNTFSIVVAQRTKELALLRAIGATGRQVKRAVKIEAVFTGMVGAAVGLVGGIGIDYGITAMFKAIGFELPGGSPVIAVRTILLSFVVGIGVAVISAWFPARRAASIPPLAAMADVAIDHSATSRGRIVVGIVVAVISGTALVLGLTALDGNTAAAAVGVSAALGFITASILGPVVALPAARVLGAPLPRMRGMAGTLAKQNAMRNPKRTSSTAMALLIGVGLVSFILVVSSSLKARLTDAIDKQLAGDLVVHATGSQFGGGFSPTVAETVSALPTVRDVTAVGNAEAKVDGSTEFISAVQSGGLTKVIDMGRVQGNLDGLGIDQVALSETFAKDHQLTIGSPVTVAFPATGEVSVTVGAIYENTEAMGPVVLNRDLVAKNVINQLDAYVFLNTTPGTSVTQLRSSLETALADYPTAEVQDRKEFTDSFLGPFNQFLGIVYALLGLSILIAVFGITNTLTLSIHERTRELGLLRAVGTTRGQLKQTVRWESVIVALFGALGGLVLGLIFGISIVSAMDSDSVKLAIPTGSLIVVTVIAALFGVVAAWRPARRASKLNVLAALAST